MLNNYGVTKKITPLQKYWGFRIPNRNNKKL